MNFAETIGKVVIRTQPARHNDPSFQKSPIEVLSYSDGKMVCCGFDPTGLAPDYVTDYVFELDKRWQDENWELFDYSLYL